MDHSDQKTHYKRGNYFIDKNFQTKFILKFCALVLIGGVLTIGLLYGLASKSTTVAIVDSRVVVKTTSDFILPVLIQTVIVVMMFVSLGTVIITLFVSHRIAGPLYRFKKMMEVLSGGDFSKGFGLRDHDQLRNFADAFNGMISNTRTELTKFKDNCLSLEEELNNISEEDIPKSKARHLSKLKEISAELNKIKDHFET